MIRFAANAAATAAAKVASGFEWPAREPPKIAHSSCGICTLSNTQFLGPSRVFIQNGMSIGSAVFVQLTVECRITLQCTATFSPKIIPSYWDFVTLLEEGRAADIGNMRRKNDKDRMCGSGDILADRQTDRQTDRHTHRRAHHNTSPPLPRAK